VEARFPHFYAVVILRDLAQLQASLVDAGHHVCLVPCRSENELGDIVVKLAKTCHPQAQATLRSRFEMVSLVLGTSFA